MGARAIGEELELLFLDPVFHLPTGTIQIFVQGSRLPVLRSERGDDETGILPLGQIFGLAHHAPLTGPTLASLIDCAAALRMRHGTSKSPWRPRARGE